ncbi:hypothetical protein OIU78_024123 [Salix suchowensis]|nr:hypothetical protein OIU78_024123 [Salix suchowensis]
MARRRRRRRRISNHQSQTSFTPRSFYWIRYIFTPWQCVWTILFRFVKCTPAITMVWPSAHTHVATGETSVIDIPEKPIGRSSGHVPPPPPHHLATQCGKTPPCTWKIFSFFVFGQEEQQWQFYRGVISCLLYRRVRKAK